MFLRLKGDLEVPKRSYRTKHCSNRGRKSDKMRARLENLAFFCVIGGMRNRARVRCEREGAHKIIKKIIFQHGKARVCVCARSRYWKICN